MSEMNFGRQLKPVQIEISGGEPVDRQHWMDNIRRFLNHQPCVTQRVTPHGDRETLLIYPDANND